MSPSETTSVAADDEADALGVGGPRSEGTRRAILDAARAMFARCGYEQTTIRAVAAQAEVDASMVIRYFQSKAGLFTAAVTTDLRVPDLRAVAANGRGESLVRYFVDRWEGPGRDDKLIALRFEQLAALSADEVVAAVAPSVAHYLTW